MQDGKRFIFKIDAIKKEIEARHKREFDKLYRRIGNDLINITTNSNNANFNTIIQNYKPDYIYIFRRIFQDVKESGMGFEIRSQLNFNKRNIIELKSVEVPKEEQDKVNNRFDVLYTMLLNNSTENLISDDFLKSEANYFEGAYQDAQKDYSKYVNDIQTEINKTRNELLLLAGAVLASEIQKRKIKQKRLEALEKQIKKVQENAKTETVKQFKNQLEKKIPTRSQSNAEYGTGQASSEIREAEYQAIKESGARESPKQSLTNLVTGKLLIDRIKKIWVHYSRRNPRHSHLALNGTEPDSQGNFYVGGYYTQKPRDYTLPASESVRCRCEVEYVVR